MAITRVQSVSASSGITATSVGATLAAAVAGNLIVAAVAADKNAGWFRPPAGAWYEVVSQPSVSVSLWVGFMEAVGGETLLTVSWETAAPDGGRIWLAEYADDSGLGGWVVDRARNPTDELNTLVWSSGAVHATTAGQALAFFAVDSVGSTTPLPSTYSNGFAALHSEAGSGIAGIAVADKAVTANTDVETTETHTGTADQVSGALMVIRRGPTRIRPDVAPMRARI